MIVWSGAATALVGFVLLLFGIAGYVATRLGVQSIWLPLWLSVFEVIRPVSFFLLPAGFLLSCLTLRSELNGRYRILLALLDVAVPLLLFGAAVGIEQWLVGEGKRRSISSRADGVPVGAQAREAGGTVYLPDLSLETLEGKQVKIQDLIRGGKVAVLVFWASYDSSWCRNVRTVNANFEAHKSEGLVVVGINEQEPKDGVQKFIQKEGIAFPVVLDINGEYLQSLHLHGSIEKVLVVDASGRVIENLSRCQEVQDRLADIVQRQLRDQQ